MSVQDSEPQQEPTDSPVSRDPLWRWKLAGVVALAVIVLSIPIYVVKEKQRATVAMPTDDSVATFVGRESCIECHQGAYEKWRGSDHDHAMAPASEETVRGDFDNAVFEYGGVTSRFYRRDGRYFVHTEGSGGEMGEFEILYTFGIEPLQQYLIPLPGGRLQALSTAWDVEQQRWFFLYPGQAIAADDWLHWTRNGQNWNGMCAECHSTNLVKGYDPDTNTYDTTWSEIDVSCEACHGPGSRHVAWAETPAMARPDAENYGLTVRTGGLDNRQQVELCAPCHSRRSELGDYDHSQRELLDTFVPALLREGTYHVDGQILEEDYVWGSFVQSKMYHNGVRCSDCHDVHSLALHKPGNALCTQCHQADAYDVPDHHFHQKVYRGQLSDGALCVKCHMPEQPFMVIDYRADHSLRVPRPDLSVALGVPNACSQSGCHDDKSIEWAAEAYTKWYGKARKPHFAGVLAASRAGAPEARDALIKLVENPLYPGIVRATALAELQAHPSADTTRAVKRALADEEALIRNTAVESLAPADASEAVALLAPLLSDPVRAVRLRAAARLAELPSPSLQPYQREAFDEALADYVRSMQRSLDFTFAGMNLGNLYAARGELGKAEQYYRTAIDVDDRSYPVKMNLAVLLSQQGRDGEAEQLLRDVLALEPDQHQAAYSLALLLATSGRGDEAEPLLRQAAEGLPGNARIHYNYGLLLQQLGKDEQAETALTNALSLEPQNFDYLYALTDFYAKRERLWEALVLTQRMIDTNPDNRTGHELKALIEREMRARDMRSP